MADGRWSCARRSFHLPTSNSHLPIMTISLHHYLVVSFLLFALGLFGVLVRRNVLVIYMSLELMLNAANLALVAFSHFRPDNNLDGQVFVFFIITVAAAEVAVGLALIVALYRKKQTVHVEDLTRMKL